MLFLFNTMLLNFAKDKHKVFIKTFDYSRTLWYNKDNNSSKESYYA